MAGASTDRGAPVDIDGDGRPTTDSPRPSTSGTTPPEALPASQPAAAVETATCPLCDAAEAVTVLCRPPYGVVRCAGCGAHYLSPRLPEAAMMEVYRSGAYFEEGAHGYDDYAAQEPALRATFRRVVDGLVRAGFGGGDLLEIGCGYGFLLDEAAAAFRSRTGLEVSAPAAETARRRGLHVIDGTLADLAPDARFDCIISSHVIEHVYDPPAFAAEVRDRLRPGGVAVIGAPDMGSLWRRAMGSRWPSYKIPEHVTYFDRASLERLLGDAGFEAVRPFSFPHAFPLGLVLAKLRLAGVAARLGGLGRRPIWLPATTVAVAGRRPAGPMTIDPEHEPAVPG